MGIGDDMDMVDNTELEELIKSYKEEITAEKEKLLIDKLKQSHLFLPVEFSDNLYESVENTQPGEIFTPGQVGFDIRYLNGDDGTKAIPLFTSDEKMEEANFKSSTVAFHVTDLLEMFRKATERYDVVFVNPYTEFELGMSLRQFIDALSEGPGEEFMQFNNLILDLLEKQSIELEKNTQFYTRLDENLFKDYAVDGVYTPNIPLNVNSKKDFDEQLKYLYIIRMPKSMKILYVGDTGIPNLLDVFIAPDSEFKFIEDLDEYTSVWECVSQPFYEK